MVTELPKRRRHFLKDKDSKRFLLEVTERLGADITQMLGPKTRIEVNEIENTEIFTFNGRPLLARSNETLFPTLFFEELFPRLPKVVVDMGAVPYVCKGADVMAPGVLSIKNEFKEKDVLLVVDERHGKTLAVGEAIFSSEEMRTVKGGKTVKNLHYVGDKLWKGLKSF